MDEITRYVSDFAIQASFNNLPVYASFYIQRAVLDTIGCALLGIETERGRTAVDLASRLAGPEESSIKGTSYRVSSTNAAFANGELMNALDYDAMTDVGKHDVPVILAAALATAESIGAAGKDLITAVAVGLEVSARLSSGKDKIQVATPNPPAVMGGSTASIAAAVAAGVLLELDLNQMSNAVGISAYLCPPSTFRKWLETNPVKMIKYGSTGWGAQAGVTAALMAQAGYSGDTEVFRGEYGFWKFSARSKPLDKDIFADLGTNWLWHRINFKRYPCGGVLSGILNQFIQLIELNDISADDIESIVACAPAVAGFALFKNNCLETPDDYCFNIGYLLACAVYRIRRSLWHSDATRNDPQVAAFMRRLDLQVITDKKPAQPLQVVAKGKMYTGDALSSGKPEAGDVQAFDGMILDKFRDNVSSRLSFKTTELAIEQLLGLENIADINSLMQLTSRPF